MTPALELKPASIRVSHVTTLHTEVGLGFRVRIRIRVRVRVNVILGSLLVKVSVIYSQKEPTTRFNLIRYLQADLL